MPRKQTTQPYAASIPPQLPARQELLGYGRASPADPECLGQVEALADKGVRRDDIHLDPALDRSTDRAGWRRCLGILKAGDALVVGSADRLGRDLSEAMTAVCALKEKGVHLVVLAMGLDTRTPEGGFAYSTLAAFSTIERELTQERVRNGLQKARKRGVVGGARPRFSDDDIEAAVKENGVNGAARVLKASKTTVIRRMQAITRRREQAAVPGMEPAA